MGVHQLPKEPLTDSRWGTDSCDHRHRSEEAARRCEDAEWRRRERETPATELVELRIAARDLLEALSHREGRGDLCAEEMIALGKLVYRDGGS